jgi:hypothetical protein
VGLQILLIEFGGEFMKTTPLSLELWVITVLIGSITLVIGSLMRVLLPVDEDPETYFDVALVEKGEDGGVVQVDPKGHVKPQASTGSMSPQKVAPV